MQFNVELHEIISELQSQLHLNGIQLLQKSHDTPTDIMIQCPYHGNGQEKRPSAGIRKTDGMFHCFACNETHSLIEVISHCFGKDAIGKFGWQWLTKNFATVSIEERDSIQLDFMRKSQNAPIKIDYVSEEELDKYRYTHPYWKKRKITDEHIIELFDLGYDRDTDCITFPVRNVNGECLFVARRSTKTKYFNYPAGAEKPLYGLYELHKWFDTYSKDHSNALSLDFDFDIDSKRPIGVNFPQEIIVCESMLDALTAWQYGKYAVAMNGLGTELQFQQLRDLPCRKLVLATDNDKAGMKARDRIKSNVKNKIITEYIFPKDRKDLNELSLSEFEALEEVF